MNIVWRVDIDCLQAGHYLGTVELAMERDPIPVEWLFRRCAVCGGQPVRGESLRCMLGEPVEIEKPRRGRPPKRLEQVA